MASTTLHSRAKEAARKLRSEARRQKRQQRREQKRNKTQCTQSASIIKRARELLRGLSDGELPKVMRDG